MAATASSPYLRGPVSDHLLGWAWLIVALIVWPWRHSSDVLRTLAGIGFIISFAHQPLTLGLVYGDATRWRSRPVVFSIMPLLAIVGVLAMWTISLPAMALIAVAWNAQHTLMQRFGLLRIYGRKNGDRHGALERSIIITLFIVAVSSIGAFTDTTWIAPRLGLGMTNRQAIRMLLPFVPYAMPVFALSAVVAAVLIVWWVRIERRTGGTIAKWSYAAATLGLVALIVIDPVVGIIAYVTAHSIEYVAVVRASVLGRRDDALIARMTRTPPRRALTVLGYIGALAAVVAVANSVDNGYTFAILVFGALHIVFDGMVWKLRRPEVSAPLGVPLAI